MFYFIGFQSSYMTKKKKYKLKNTKKIFNNQKYYILTALSFFTTEFYTHILLNFEGHVNSMKSFLLFVNGKSVAFSKIFANNYFMATEKVHSAFSWNFVQVLMY